MPRTTVVNFNRSSHTPRAVIQAVDDKTIHIKVLDPDQAVEIGQRFTDALGRLAKLGAKLPKPVLIGLLIAAWGIPVGLAIAAEGSTAASISAAILNWKTLPGVFTAIGYAFGLKQIYNGSEAIRDEKKQNVENQSESNHICLELDKVPLVVQLKEQKRILKEMLKSEQTTAQFYKERIEALHTTIDLLISKLAEKPADHSTEISDLLEVTKAAIEKIKSDCCSHDSAKDAANTVTQTELSLSIAPSAQSSRFYKIGNILTMIPGRGLISSYCSTETVDKTQSSVQLPRAKLA